MCVCAKFGFYFMSSTIIYRFSNSRSTDAGHKHLVSKHASNRYSKGTEVFGSKSSKAGTSEIGIVHKSTVFVYCSSERKNLLLTSLLFPLGEKDKTPGRLNRVLWIGGFIWVFAVEGSETHRIFLLGTGAEGNETHKFWESQS